MKNGLKVAILLLATAFSQNAMTQSQGQIDSVKTDRALPQRVVRPDPGSRLRWISLGEVRTSKIVDERFSFRPDPSSRVERIRLVGTNSGNIIRSFLVELRNGERIDLRQLEGRLREGERVDAFIGGAYIREIYVVATTESLIGSRGKFRVEVGVYNY
jgi:hypothetical protein